MKCKPIYIIIFLLLLHLRAAGQLIDLAGISADSTCITDQSDRLLLRIFLMQKFNKYTLGQHGMGNNLTYRANNNYHIGLGFHYRWVGANVSFKLPYFNAGKYGKTDFFDLQSYLYLSKIALDLHILSYKGYYLADNSILRNPPPGKTRVLREDLYTGNFGFNFQYIFNSSRFSYRAAFIQNQCQVKSAGSWLAGFAINYTRARGDSAIIPANIVDDNFYHGHGFNKSAAFVVAFNGGYAYTQVIKKNFFITASAVVGTGLNYVALKTDATDQRDSRLHVQLHAILRGAAGYNTDKRFIGLQYINYINRNNMPVLDSWQQSQVGNIRLTYAHRFQLKKKTVKRLDNISDKVLPDALTD